MIDLLEPDDVTISQHGVLLKCGFVTFEALASGRDQDSLSDSQGPVHTRLFVDETGFTLCAFSSRERRSLFDHLLKVKGVGRRTAILVLELGERSDVLRAAASDDVEFFRGIPGLGPSRIRMVFDSLKKLPSPPPTSIPVSEWVQARESVGGGDRFDVELESSGLSLSEFMEKIRPETG